MDQAILLYFMVKKKKVDAWWIIFNNILESVGPTKGLWFPAIITKLCIQYGVKVDNNEKRIKARLAITARVSNKSPQLEGID